MYAHRADDLSMTPPALEDLAREDATLDQQLSEPLMYPQYQQWAERGVITAEEWQRYHASYTAAQSTIRAMDQQAP